MSNEVYANMMEVSCKVASGKSICSFPDVCMTPPQTPATPPGVPIPYPNTGMASDCSDGSSTVKISGQEVMLKDKSYFKRSSGDEAGCAPQKGVVNSQNMGKVYFVAWSMDVMVENENVVRHFDLTTHNHGSNANQSIPWLHTDKMKAAFGEGGICEGVDEQLILTRYSPEGCPKPKTPHHLIPKRCFANTPGYSSNSAPCICVLGKNQHTGSHRGCHRIFDPIELAMGAKFDYRSARYAAACSAGAGLDEPRKLDDKEKACVEAQLDAYHKDDPNGPKVSDKDKIRATGRPGKVNEYADHAEAIFKS